MVVSPEHIDQSVGAPELVTVIGHIRHQVGGLAVALEEHPVLVVTMVGAAQPDGASLFVDGTDSLEIGQRRVDGTRGDHRPLTKP